MEVPLSDIEGCHHAHERLATVVAGVGDADISRPSRLPDWSVGHVLTHLARNAEAMWRRVDGVKRGELVEQYVGGRAGRAAEIEAGSSRSARDIERDVVDWSHRLDDLFQSLPDEYWGRSVLTVGGGEHPVALLPFRRWREVEAHLVDLGLGVTPGDLPREFVDRALPGLLADLPGRADQRSLTAWLLGRGQAPDLSPWG